MLQKNSLEDERHTLESQLADYQRRATSAEEENRRLREENERLRDELRFLRTEVRQEDRRMARRGCAEAGRWSQRQATTACVARASAARGGFHSFLARSARLPIRG